MFENVPQLIIQAVVTFRLGRMDPIVWLSGLTTIVILIVASLAIVLGNRGRERAATAVAGSKIKVVTPGDAEL